MPWFFKKKFSLITAKWKINSAKRMIPTAVKQTRDVDCSKAGNRNFEITMNYKRI
jgi:hypothetical protein